MPVPLHHRLNPHRGTQQIHHPQPSEVIFSQVTPALGAEQSPTVARSIRTCTYSVSLRNHRYGESPRPLGGNRAAISQQHKLGNLLRTSSKCQPHRDRGKTPLAGSRHVPTGNQHQIMSPVCVYTSRAMSWRPRRIEPVFTPAAIPIGKPPPRTLPHIGKSVIHRHAVSKPL